MSLNASLREKNYWCSQKLPLILVKRSLPMKVLRRFCTLDVSVCVYSLDGESCECELCFGGRMVGGVGGSGVGGKMGHCHCEVTVPSQCQRQRASRNDHSIRSILLRQETTAVIHRQNWEDKKQSQS